LAECYKSYGAAFGTNDANLERIKHMDLLLYTHSFSNKKRLSQCTGIGAFLQESRMAEHAVGCVPRIYMLC